MNRKILATFAILTFLTIAILSRTGVDANKSRRRFRWYNRRMIRHTRRPTNSISGISQGKVDSVKSAQKNEDDTEQQGFDTPEQAEEYWESLYQDGKMHSHYSVISLVLYKIERFSNDDARLRQRHTHKVENAVAL